MSDDPCGSAGHKLTFYEMGDEIPDGAAGDVFIVLDVQEHAVFKRKGCDLYLRRDISLVEALCGFSMEIDHLDGRKLLVKTDPGVRTFPGHRWATICNLPRWRYRISASQSTTIRSQMTMYDTPPSSCRHRRQDIASIYGC
jgi:hypothetical protein|eukprot:SAG25_NODE_114_length_14860_cov_13.403672_9_plen_141_part_00